MWGGDGAATIRDGGGGDQGPGGGGGVGGETGYNKSFVATSLLLQAYKTRLLSRQKYAREFSFVATKGFFRGKHTFVATNTCFSRQKKMILVAARASDMVPGKDRGVFPFSSDPCSTGC